MREDRPPPLQPAELSALKTAVEDESWSIPGTLLPGNEKGVSGHGCGILEESNSQSSWNGPKVQL